MAIDYFDANLHTHTTYSDGNHDPHQSIDHYRELGYRILTLSSHDTCHYEVRPSSLYPWTALNEIFHEIKDQPHGCRDATFGEQANEEWQDRNTCLMKDLSLDAFTDAIRNGHLYLFVPEERGVASDNRIHTIEASDNRIRLEIEGEPEMFEWIILDPQTERESYHP